MNEITNALREGIDNYMSVRTDLEGNSNLTTEEKEWLLTQYRTELTYQLQLAEIELA